MLRPIRGILSYSGSNCQFFAVAMRKSLTYGIVILSVWSNNWAWVPCLTAKDEGCDLLASRQSSWRHLLRSTLEQTLRDECASKLRDQRSLDWYFCHVPRTPWQTQSYLTLPGVTVASVRYIVRLRLAVSELQVDRGRYSGAPREARTCRLCSKAVEDTRHLFVCPILMSIVSPFIISMRHFWTALPDWPDPLFLHQIVLAAKLPSPDRFADSLVVINRFLSTCFLRLRAAAEADAAAVIAVRVVEADVHVVPADHEETDSDLSDLERVDAIVHLLE